MNRLWHENRRDRFRRYAEQAAWAAAATSVPASIGGLVYGVESTKQSRKRARRQATLDEYYRKKKARREQEESWDKQFKDFDDAKAVARAAFESKRKFQDWKKSKRMAYISRSRKRRYRKGRRGMRMYKRPRTGTLVRKHLLTIAPMKTQTLLYGQKHLQSASNKKNFVFINGLCDAYTFKEANSASGQDGHSFLDNAGKEGWAAYQMYGKMKVVISSFTEVEQYVRPIYLSCKTDFGDLSSDLTLQQIRDSRDEQLIALVQSGMESYYGSTNSALIVSASPNKTTGPPIVDAPGYIATPEVAGFRTSALLKYFRVTYGKWRKLAPGQDTIFHLKSGTHRMDPQRMQYEAAANNDLAVDYNSMFQRNKSVYLVLEVVGSPVGHSTANYAYSSNSYRSFHFQTVIEQGYKQIDVGYKVRDLTDYREDPIALANYEFMGDIDIGEADAPGLG